MQSIIHLDTDPPRVEFPSEYNAAADLLGLNRAWPNKAAYILGDQGQVLNYASLEDQARRWASALQAEGFEPEQRVMLAMHDTLEWPVAFLGCILAGVVPIAVNTLLTTQDFEYMLRDSRAKGLITSTAFTAILWASSPTVIVSGTATSRTTGSVGAAKLLSPPVARPCRGPPRPCQPGDPAPRKAP